MQTKEINIKKARLNKNGTVETNYTDTDGNDITLRGSKKAHPDLRASLDALVPYFADLTEQKEADYIDWVDLTSEHNKELLKRIRVTGVSIGGDESNRFITITGNRTLLTSRVINLNSLGVELDNEAFEWAFTDQFDLDLEGFLFEVREYILNHKYDTTQTEFNFEDDPADPFASPDTTDEVGALDASADHVA